MPPNGGRNPGAAQPRDPRARGATERMRPSPQEPSRSESRRALAVSETTDTRIRVLAAAAVRKDGKVLVMREEDEPYRKSWVLPQGYPRPGETLPDAAVRETREELGLEIVIDRLLGVYEDLTTGPSGSALHWVIICYLAHPLGNKRPRPSREAIDFAWIDSTTHALQSPSVIQRILNDLGQSADD